MSEVCVCRSAESQVRDVRASTSSTNVLLNPSRDQYFVIRVFLRYRRRNHRSTLAIYPSESQFKMIYNCSPLLWIIYIPNSV